jgi:preprotein translocase subunit SecG
MLFAALLVVFLLVCVLLCLLILIQSDKGGGLSGAIGGLSGASGFLGTQDTANVLTKGTYVMGSVFLVLCVLMTLFAPGDRENSALRKIAEKKQSETVTSRPVSAFGADGFGEEAGSGLPSAGGGAEAEAPAAPAGGE